MRASVTRRARRSCIALALLGCGTESPPDVEDWTWDLPAHFSPPEVPADNPMSVEKVELGRLLFNDFQLSLNGDRSCGICHEQKKGFTDGFARSVGSEEVAHPRNSLSVVNVAWRGPLTWRNPELYSLEEQLLIPLMGEEPIVEMGMGGHEGVLLGRLCEMDGYPELFEAAFPDEADPITVDNLARAIASYERTIISGDSPYDRAFLGDAQAMSESAMRGQALFEGDRLNCWRCHSGTFLDQPILSNGSLGEEPGFFNIGLYDIDGEGSYPPEDPGLYALTGDLEDMGAFRTPSLRNVERTGPWGHDGSLASLDDVLMAYSRGGRELLSGQYAGDGAQSPLKDPLIVGFEISEEESEDLIEFLLSLTDEGVLTDTQFANPFCLGEETDLEDCIEPVMGPGSR